MEQRFNSVLQDISEISNETVRTQLEDWYDVLRKANSLKDVKDYYIYL